MSRSLQFCRFLSVDRSTTGASARLADLMLLFLGMGLWFCFRRASSSCCWTWRRSSGFLSARRSGWMKEPSPSRPSTLPSTSGQWSCSNSLYLPWIRSEKRWILVGHCGLVCKIALLTGGFVAAHICQRRAFWPKSWWFLCWIHWEEGPPKKSTVEYFRLEPSFFNLNPSNDEASEATPSDWSQPAAMSPYHLACHRVNLASFFFCRF